MNNRQWRKWRKKQRQKEKKIRKQKKFWRDYHIGLRKFDKEYRQFVELPNT